MMKYSMILMVAAAILASSITAQPVGQEVRAKNETRNDDQAGAQYDQAAGSRATTGRATTFQTVAATADQSAAVVTADEQPAADQPAADQPAADQPAADQPAVDQSAAYQPAVNQSAAAAAAAAATTGNSAVVDKQPQPQYTGAEQHGAVADRNNVTAVHGFGYNSGIAQADQADRNHHAHRNQAERIATKNNVY